MYNSLLAIEEMDFENATLSPLCDSMEEFAYFANYVAAHAEELIHSVLPIEMHSACEFIKTYALEIALRYENSLIDETPAELGQRTLAIYEEMAEYEDALMIYSENLVAFFPHISKDPPPLPLRIYLVADPKEESGFRSICLIHTYESSMIN
jgi:hypothetical protein